MTNVTKTLKSRSWRTQKMHDRYESERQNDVQSDECPLCKAETLEEFTHWRIIPNKYPYDAVAHLHTMIIPKEHCVEAELTPEALAELYELKYNSLNDSYSFIFEALPGSKSIPGHFHLHLIQPKVVG